MKQACRDELEVFFFPPHYNKLLYSGVYIYIYIYNYMKRNFHIFQEK